MPELDAGNRKMIIGALLSAMVAALTMLAPALGLSDMQLASGIGGITTIAGILLAANAASKFAAAMGRSSNAPIDNRIHDR